MHVLPGKAKASAQAICIGEWDGDQYIIYLSGTAFSILRDAKTLIQTTYLEGDLQGIAFHELSGKIAIYSSQVVYIFYPEKQGENQITWKQGRSLLIQESAAATSSINAVSWGLESEIFVGGDSLSLWSIPQDSKGFTEIWKKPLPNPTNHVELSHDAELIATAGRRDRLVKIWHRQTFGCEDPQFDFFYLPHPRAITGLKWRKPFHREMTTENVLYTICKDNVVRLWSPVDAHEVHSLQLSAAIDMETPFVSPIKSEKQPRDAKNPTKINGFEEHKVTRHHPIILDSKAFTVAAELAMQRSPADKEYASVNRLLDIANKNPDVVLVLYSNGTISAWSLENISYNPKKKVIVSNIFNRLKANFKNDNFVQTLSVANKAFRNGLSILTQHFSGEIYIYDSRLDQLLDTSPTSDRLSLNGIWSGHDVPIKWLARTANGRYLLSASHATDLTLWNTTHIKERHTIKKRSFIAIEEREKVKYAIVLEHGTLVTTLHKSYVILWDCSMPNATEITRYAIDVKKEWLCHFLIPEVEDKKGSHHVAAITSDGDGFVWEVRAAGSDSTKVSAQDRNNQLRLFAKFGDQNIGDTKLVVPVDPVGWSFTLSGTLDTFNREVALSLSSTGLLRTWTAIITLKDSSISWLVTSSVETSIQSASLASGSSKQKVAILDEGRTQLTIWDTKNAQLEFSLDFTQDDLARDLDWTCTPDSQSILAVGFDHKVLLLAQLRYDYLSAGPSWAPIREISIQKYTTHPIGDSIWLSHGTLVIGAGNQFFIQSKNIHEETIDVFLKENLSAVSELKPIPSDIFNLVSRLNGPVAVYHPQFLQQCILAGKTVAVKTILVALYKYLKYEITIDAFLGIDTSQLLDQKQIPLLRRVSHTFRSVGSSDETRDVIDFNEAMATSLMSLLKDANISNITSSEQVLLRNIVDCVSQVEEHRRSLDENGARYLMFFKQHSLRKTAESEALNVSMREVIWAYHSESQEILLDLVSRSFEGKMVWSQAKEAGVFMWLKDIGTIRSQFEKMARNIYVMSDDKNPVECSLFYLALKKKMVLSGLWRMAIGNREQATTQKFLANDFREKRWQTAALKNAYALMGKQRFEYAAAFFLLADSLKDAVNVCFTQLNDMQLAIAVARVYEGDNGPVFTDLLRNKILPLAAQQGNKWLATWSFWMLGRRADAVRTLITPIESLIHPSQDNTTAQESKLFLADDPALAVLYSQIRDKSIKTLQGAEMIPQGAEFRFVMQTARLYDRMGCDVLALDLVRNWTFLRQAKDLYNPLISHNPRRMTRRRSSYVVVDDVANDESIMAPTIKAGLNKPPAAVFQEPDMNSFAHFDF